MLHRNLTEVSSSSSIYGLHVLAGTQLQFGKQPIGLTRGFTLLSSDEHLAQVQYHMTATQQSQTMNLATFVEVLKRSELVDPERLRRTVKATITATHDQKPSPTQVSTKLINAGLLTQWQATKLLKGKYRGFKLGNYIIRQPLGRGGMGVVYEAEHAMLNTRVALKLLPKAKNDSEKSVSRFVAEARAAAKLDHRNLTRVHDFDVIDGRRFMVMELIVGSDLGDLVLRNGHLSVSLSLSLTKQAADGLGFAHDRGVIHRDVKPQNFLVTRDGHLKVTDLGLALFQVDSPTRHTSEGENSIVGTVDFVAPEQAYESTNVDRRADIYSLGCTLYFMLTGRPPFATGSLAQRIACHQTATPKPVTEFRNDVPASVLRLLALLVEKRPQDRIQRMEEVAEACEQISEHLEMGSDDAMLLSRPKAKHSLPQRARWNSTELLGLQGSDSHSNNGPVSTNTIFGLENAETVASNQAVARAGDRISNDPAASTNSANATVSSATDDTLPDYGVDLATVPINAEASNYWQVQQPHLAKEQRRSLTDESPLLQLLTHKTVLLWIGLALGVFSIGFTLYRTYVESQVEPQYIRKINTEF